MERKRGKSENTEDKRVCVTPVTSQTLVSDQEEQQTSPFEEWDAGKVASFLSENGIDEQALKGNLCMA